MNKEEFLSILEVSLLSFDGVLERNIRKMLPGGSAYPDKIVKAGIKLSNYFKIIEIIKRRREE